MLLVTVTRETWEISRKCEITKGTKIKVMESVTRGTLWGKCGAGNKRNPEIRISHSQINICEQSWGNKVSHSWVSGRYKKTKISKRLTTEPIWHPVIWRRSQVIWRRRASGELVYDSLKKSQKRVERSQNQQQWRDQSEFHSARQRRLNEPQF